MAKPLVLLVFLGFVGFSLCIVCDPKPGTPANSPIGTARGINPGRVVWTYDRNAANWDYYGKYWWSAKYTNQTVVDEMLDKTLRKLTGEDTSLQAWDSLFEYFNDKHHGEQRGYKAGEKIAMKINLNGMLGTYEPVQGNGLSPQFLKSIIRQLVKVVGVAQEDICIYDASRWMTDNYYSEPEGSHEEFPNVRYIDNHGGDGREQVQYDPNVPLYFSSHDVPGWNYTRLPTCATEADYMIETANFRGHDVAGMTMSGKNWFGSIYRPDCDCGPSGHWYHFTNITNPLSISMTQNVAPVEFFMSPFCWSWTSSIFASQDPIALDSVAFDFLNAEPMIGPAKRGCVDNYLHEGALADNPPSGTVYNPSGEAPLESLGVHEHWNNAEDKQYSRNLKTGDGIELVRGDQD